MAARLSTPSRTTLDGDESRGGVLEFRQNDICITLLVGVVRHERGGLQFGVRGALPTLGSRADRVQKQSGSKPL